MTGVHSLFLLAMSLEYLTEEQLSSKTKEELIAHVIRVQAKAKQLNRQLQDVKLSQIDLVRHRSPRPRLSPACLSLQSFTFTLRIHSKVH